MKPASPVRVWGSVALALAGWARSQDLVPLALPGPPADTLAADSAAAGGADTASDTVSWSSHRFSYDAQTDRFSLFDEALLIYKGARLRADTIYMDNERQIVEARGSPVIQEQSQPEVFGYRLKYNNKRGVGEIYYGVTRRDGQLFAGIEVRRQNTGEFYIARGCFTACGDAENYNYFFYSRRLVLEPNRTVLARPVVMNIQDVPVAVLPMLVVPLGKGRRSGFTRTKIGGDQAQGFFIRDLGYYWALSEYTDLQLAGDLIEGSEGTFDNANIRSRFLYNRRYTLNGSLDANAYISQFNPAGSKWEVNFAHDQLIAPDGSRKLTGTGRFVSSPLVLQEALEESEAVNQTANARLGYSHIFRWNRARFNAGAIQEYNLTTGRQDRELPRATLAFSAPLMPTARSEVWDGGGGGEVDWKWLRRINYNYSGDFSVYSQESGEGRLGTSIGSDSLTHVGTRNQVGLNAKYTALRFINITPSLDFQHYWSLHSRLGPQGAPAVDWSPTQGRAGDWVYKASSSLRTDTRLFGIAVPEWGPLRALRHVVTPSAGFTYAPAIDTNPHFFAHPKLAASPFQAASKTVSLGLGNDVDVKWSASGARDADSVRTHKIFDASTRANYNFEAPGRKWSRVEWTLNTHLVRYVPLSVQLSQSLYDEFGPPENRDEIKLPGTLMRYSFGWRKDMKLSGDFNSGLLSTVPRREAAGREMSPWSVGMSYGFQFSADRVSSTVFQKSLTHNFSGNLTLRPTPKWEMGYRTAFDFEKGEFSRHAFTFQRELHCWQMDFSWTPVGIGEGWRFNIFITDIPDIKLESSQTNLRRP